MRPIGWRRSAADDAPLSTPPSLSSPGTPDGELSGPISMIVDRLAALEAQGGEYHRRAAHRETVISELHARNQKLEAGLGRSLLEPVVTDLIRLHDDLTRESARLAGHDGDAPGVKLLASFAADVEAILDRCGLEPFSATAGDQFTVGEHLVLSARPTDDPEQDNRVAEVVAVGFREREGARVRRPLKAHFHRFQPAPVENPAGQPPAADPPPPA